MNTLYFTKAERLGFLTIIVLVMICHSISLVKLSVKQSDLYNLTVQPTNSQSKTTAVQIRDTGDFEKRNEYPKEKRVNLPIKATTKTTTKDFISNSKPIEYKNTKALEGAPDTTVKFKFDPNTISQDSLKILGLNSYAAQNLIKYRNAGGSFKTDSGLLKIYGIDTSEFENLRPFVEIVNNERENALKLNNRLPIDINTALAEEFIPLYGIGPVLSQRIVDFRKRLGGYTSIDQIREVYGISEETFDSIKDKLYITSGVQKIYPPELEFKEILKHPYIDYETTKLLKNISVIDYKQGIQKLIEEELISPKVLPYLALE